MAKRSELKSIPIYREDQSKCMHWCINNGIKIEIMLGESEYAVKYSFREDVNGVKEKRTGTYCKIEEPYEKGLVRIKVNNNGAITKSPNLYLQKEANMKIWELYCHLYDTNS